MPILLASVAIKHIQTRVFIYKKTKKQLELNRCTVNLMAWKYKRLRNLLKVEKIQIFVLKCEWKYLETLDLVLRIRFSNLLLLLLQFFFCLLEIAIPFNFNCNYQQELRFTCRTLVVWSFNSYNHFYLPFHKRQKLLPAIHLLWTFTRIINKHCLCSI